MKILANTPSGTQEIIDVGDGGGYFDPARVLWDERTDGPLPEIEAGGLVREGDALVFSQARQDEHNAAIAPPILQVVTMAQARKALIMGGVSIASVDAAIAGIADPIALELAQTDWEYSATVRRDSPLVTSLGPLLGLSDAQIDDLFVLADTL